MSSFPPSDPDRLPPPDYKNQTAEQWAAELKQRGGGPPLRGLAVDPQYPPTEKDAERVLRKMRSEGREAQLSRDEPVSSIGEEQQPLNTRRSSGASKLFSTAPTTNEVINTMPGGDAHTAGGFASMEGRTDPIPEANLTNAFRQISTSSFTSFHQQPCVRESLLTGFGFGAGIGGIVWVAGFTPWRATKYAYIGFGVSALANYQYCQVQRRREREGMRTAIKIVEEKKEEKRLAAEKRREEIRKRKEEAQKLGAQAKDAVKSSTGSWSRWWEGRPGEREG